MSKHSDLAAAIRSIPDYPKPGIIFRDITTLLGDPVAFRQAVDELVKPYQGLGVHKIAGIEARGFILGGALAHQLSAGFVPIRKKGKLPHETVRIAYSLEYGVDEMEMHVDAINPGDRVILTDDLIATGGTAEGAVKLLRQQGADIVSACFVIDLPEIGGRKKLEALGVEGGACGPNDYAPWFIGRDFMDSFALLTFAAAFLFFAASPGPDNMTIVARALTQGPWTGIAYGAGTCTGILLFLALAVLGLSALASETGPVMALLRYGGALYLVWTGIKLWTAAPVLPGSLGKAKAGVTTAYLSGVILNLGNPKMPLFYIALLPNVAGNDLTASQGMILAAVIVAVEILVVGGHVLLAARARRALASPAVVRRVNRSAGAVMIGAGAAVVAAR
eukprot:g7689.t1